MWFWIPTATAFIGLHGGIAVARHLARQTSSGISVDRAGRNGVCYACGAMSFIWLMTIRSSWCASCSSSTQFALAAVSAVALALSVEYALMDDLPARLLEAQHNMWWSIRTAEPRGCEDTLLHLAKLVSMAPSCEAHPLRLRILLNTHYMTVATRRALATLAPHLQVLEVAGVNRSPCSPQPPVVPLPTNGPVRMKLIVTSPGGGELLRQTGLSTMHVACLVLNGTDGCDPWWFASLNDVSVTDCGNDATWLARYALAAPNAPTLRSLRLGVGASFEVGALATKEPFRVPLRLLGKRTRLMAHFPVVVTQDVDQAPTGLWCESAAAPRIAYLETRGNAALWTRLRADVVNWTPPSNTLDYPMDVFSSEACDRKPLAFFIKGRAGKVLINACGVRRASAERVMRLKVTLQWLRCAEPSALYMRHRCNMLTAVSAFLVACPSLGSCPEAWQAILALELLKEVEPLAARGAGRKTSCRCVVA